MRFPDARIWDESRSSYVPAVWDESKSMYVPQTTSEDTIVTDKYEISKETEKRLNNDYQYHAPKDDQSERYVYIREEAKKFAIVLCKNCPPSRELSVALTDLDKVVTMANAAIARNE